MKKIIISVLLIAIPTISNAAKEEIALPELPTLCGTNECPAGQLQDPLTCECVGSLPTICDKSPSDCGSGYYLDWDACACYRCNLDLASCMTNNTQYVVQSGTNKQVAKYYIFNSTTCDCKEYYTASCVSGYYGTASLAKSTQLAALNGVTCTVCPDGGTSTALSGKPTGQMPLDYNETVTSCYLPANTTHTDASGTYTYTSECYYK